jgi:Sua5/YciO/YrdC/YwlC family protein
MKGNKYMLIIDNPNEKSLEKAAQIIKNGGIVAIPTETVYGLAANALDGYAVSKIFIAKGRPQDNPLIVHVAEKNDIFKLISVLPSKAEILINKFWPGPLTVILPKSDLLPDEVTAGLDSVAVRMPNNNFARQIIKLAGVPLAAPSANRSGSPSPTCAKHVIHDMDGKIDAIVDGGPCSIGVESTVMSFLGEIPVLLRPGSISAEEITATIGKLEIDKAVFSNLGEKIKPASPGMKYKHYSPKAEVILVKGDREEYVNFVNCHTGDGIYSLCFDEDIELINKNAFSYGKTLDFSMQAKNIFSCLRKLDDLNAKTIYARAPKQTGVGLAVYNRLIRAAGFKIIDLECKV